MAPAALRPSSHEFVEHTGEVHLRVRAATLPELFAESGRALAGLLRRGASADPPGPWDLIELTAPDRCALLVDWLNELIFRAEVRLAVPTEFEVSGATETTLTARIRAVPVPEPPSLVKAATLHRVRVEEADGGVEADVVLDV
jgi:SHS2 domain-containing protein